MLSDFDSSYQDAVEGWESQCTFWCSVLSDKAMAGVSELSAVGVSMHLLVLSAFRPLSEDSDMTVYA